MRANWKKKGILVMPDVSIKWMSHYVGPSFIRPTSDSSFDLFLTGRDVEGVSRIGVAKGRIEGEELKILSISPTPLFDIGLPGCFDENGVSYPYIVDLGDRQYMYYVGWVAGGRTRFQNFTGLAIFDEKLSQLEARFNVPMLDRTESEPFGTGSCAVIKENDKYVILYTAFNGWLSSSKLDRNLDPWYDIKIAQSSDGVLWERSGAIAIPNVGNETIVGKPTIYKNRDGAYEVYFSARGESYRIYKATGNSLFNLTRSNIPELDVSEVGWDSEMVEYAQVALLGERKIMIYNGNNFGQTGLGYAIEIDQPL